MPKNINTGRGNGSVAKGTWQAHSVRDGVQISRTHVKSAEQLLKPLVTLALRSQRLGFTRAVWLAKTARPVSSRLSKRPSLHMSEIQGDV